MCSADPSPPHHHHPAHIHTFPSQFGSDSNPLSLPLRLLCIAASYGHVTDASKAIDVRAIIQAKIEGFGAKDCLNIPPQKNLLQYFNLDVGSSPCSLVEGRKCVRARFVVEGRKSEIIAMEGSKEVSRK